jgi:hypothetical protein
MYEGKTASKLQSGAGTANILADPGTGFIHIVEFMAWDIYVAGAGTWTVINSGAGVTVASGPTVVVGSNSMPIGRHTVSAGQTLDLVIATAGAVNVTVEYKTVKVLAP